LQPTDEADECSRTVNELIEQVRAYVEQLSPYIVVVDMFADSFGNGGFRNFEIRRSGV